MSDAGRPYIAVAVDEEGKVWGGHFGMAPTYFVYDRRGRFVESRSNPHGARRGQKVTHHDDPRLIVNLLPDCDVFIGRRMGETSRKRLVQNLGVEPVLTDSRDPTEAVQVYLGVREGDRVTGS